MTRICEVKIARAAALVARGMPQAHAADSVGIHRKSLHYALVSRGLHKPIDNTAPWSAAEERFLIATYGKKQGDVRFLAEALNRSRNSIIGKANAMGLSKSKKAA